MFFTEIFIPFETLGNVSTEYSASVLHLPTKRNQNKHFRKESYVPSMIQLSQVTVETSGHEQEYFSSVGAEKKKKKKVVGHIKTLRTI